MSLPLFSIARAGFNLYQIGSATGVIGLPDVIDALVKLAPKLYLKSRKANTDALDEMVAEAKSLVPVDTGRLLNGITGRIEDDEFIFEASAISPRGQEDDYARYVEFGHNIAHTLANPIVADESYFSADAASVNPFRAKAPKKPRKSSRGETSIEPEPFFFPAADDALEKRGVEMESVLAGLAAEEAR
jgi:hypothetical protein